MHSCYLRLKFRYENQIKFVNGQIFSINSQIILHGDVSYFPFVILDDFIVMPNHIHGIIYIDKPMKSIRQINQFLWFI